MESLSLQKGHTILFLQCLMVGVVILVCAVLYICLQLSVAEYKLVMTPVGFCFVFSIFGFALIFSIFGFALKFA